MAKAARATGPRLFEAGSAALQSRLPVPLLNHIPNQRHSSSKPFQISSVNPRFSAALCS